MRFLTLFAAAAAVSSNTFGGALAVPLESAVEPPSHAPRGLDELPHLGPEVAIPDIDPSLSPVEALAELQSAVEKTIAHDKCKRGPTQCTLAKARIRKDW